MGDYDIVGRNKEIKQIETYVTSKLGSKQNGIIHITGLPGTGKTMSVEYVLDRISSDKKFKDVRRVFVNCFKMSSCKLILGKVCADLDLVVSAKHGLQRLADELGKFFADNRVILVLDELDRLPKSHSE